MKNKYIDYNISLKYSSIPFSFTNNNIEILSLDKRLVTKPVFIYEKPLKNREKIKKDLIGF